MQIEVQRYHQYLCDTTALCQCEGVWGADRTDVEYAQKHNVEKPLETDSDFQTDSGITDPFRGVAECLLSLGLARPANLLLRGVGLLVMMFS